MLQITKKTNSMFILGCCCVAISCNKTTPSEKPNILLIMSDDHAYQAISAYNNQLISTPNIDRLASEGVLFKNAFVTNSISGPSRAVILTGKYSHINGFKDNDGRFNGDQQTFPKILKENGYATAIIGKWHLGTEPTGFDHWDILPGQGHYYNPEFINMGTDTSYSGYVTDIIAERAIEWMDKNRSRPFLMMMHNKAPHRNWMSPLKYLDEFNDVNFAFPQNFFDDYSGREAMQRQKLTVKNQLSVQYDSKVPCDTCIDDPVSWWAGAEWEREYGRLTPEEKKVWEEMMQKEYDEFAAVKDKDELTKWQFQRYMEDYLRCIRSVDDNIGRVLDFLKESGLDKNTIVIYTSDQGFYLGEHGLYDKRFMYEESLRTPMIISSPFHNKHGISNSDFVMNLDLAPTILDLTSVEIPEDMQGASMKPFISGKKIKDWRKEIYYHYYEKSYGLTRHYGIRTDRYKLIHFYDPIDSWELFDLKTDISEMHNIYDNPEYQSIVKDLKTRLFELRKKYLDEEETE